VSAHHKRPLLAFIVVAVICGMVIGHALATQAVPALWARPIAVVEGLVFAPAAASEPATPTKASAAVVPGMTVRTAASQGPRVFAPVHTKATRPANGVTSTPRHAAHASKRHATKDSQVVTARQVGLARHADWTSSASAWGKQTKHAKHRHGWHDARWSHLPPAFRWR